MRLRGYFKTCAERVYQRKDGTEGRSIECMFAVEGERDEVRVTTWHDRQWCEEHGIKTGASGELNMHMGTNERTGWYEQVIWGFKTTEQIAKEQAEREAASNTPSATEHAAQTEAKAQAAVAEAQANGEETNLPF